MHVREQLQQRRQIRQVPGSLYFSCIGGNKVPVWLQPQPRFQDRLAVSLDARQVQIQALASFVKSFNGTNPANAKAPQGDLFKEGTATPIDSTQKAGI